jgi:hypothetical protein
MNVGSEEAELISTIKMSIIPYKSVSNTRSSTINPDEDVENGY